MLFLLQATAGHAVASPCPSTLRWCCSPSRSGLWLRPRCAGGRCKLRGLPADLAGCLLELTLVLSYECGKFRLLLPGFFVDTALGTVTLVVFLVPGFLVTALDFGFGMFNMVCAPHGLHLCLLPLVRVRCSHGKRACRWLVYYLLHVLQKNLVIPLFAWFGSYYCILTVLFLVLFAAEVGCYVIPTAGRWGAANNPYFVRLLPDPALVCRPHALRLSPGVVPLVDLGPAGGSPTSCCMPCRSTWSTSSCSAPTTASTLSWRRWFAL